MKKYILTLLVATFLAHVPGLSIAKDSSSHKRAFFLDDHKGFVDFGAPKKGSANARILVDGDILLMEILTPAYNIHGVEAAPETRTPEEREQVAKASRAFLDSPQRYFSFIPANACIMEGLAYRREQVEVRADQAEQKTTRWQYYDVRSELLFMCPNGTPEQMVVELFAAFPRVDTIHVQLIENDQDLRRVKLTRDAYVIEFSEPAVMPDESAPNKSQPEETLKDKPAAMKAGEAAKEAPKNVK